MATRSYINAEGELVVESTRSLPADVCPEAAKAILAECLDAALREEIRRDAERLVTGEGFEGV